MTQVTFDPVPDLLTFEEYRLWQPPDDRHYELFRGRLVPINPPMPLHVNICQFLVYQFQRYFAEQDLNLVAKSETGVRTEPSSARIPDVTVCRGSLWEQMCRRPGSGILDFTQDELPRLVVEVVSSNWREDYLRKRAEYAIIQIPEYWIVDHRRQEVWILTNPDRPEGYEVVKRYPGDRVESSEFQGFALTVDEVLNPPFVEELMRQAQLEQEVFQAQTSRMAAKLRELGIDPDTL